MVVVIQTLNIDGTKICDITIAGRQRKECLYNPYKIYDKQQRLYINVFIYR